ncbi:nucleotidyl transferase AbiEii/AbiGii toxin family protein [Telmatocola sphagniphila]|uniref:Nucleotidyl transferase AbiEii/AbiGii toxin family protein n=1 Tax=Telmatocola sphagniphila TaxID=1123043 RepID=A0A8E6B8Q9_9BACT|nr:nucleotidyl transferase AbiEii/AbiGii toxin family protein [Telmatocola sphagniphila]QVL33826.1 nucleotidyl transferase AbiEii/AbiGii toxin family protein [Telmatocola sphagniphila]
MIPLAHLQEWTANAPWPDLRQVEQDLIICRALCDLFNSEKLQGKIAFRGGTAINKLLFSEPLRYSEDIDLVQMRAEPIGPTVDAIREALSWLGNCKRNQALHSMHLVFQFTPEIGDGKPLKLKIEINTREQQNLHGLQSYPFEVSSDWHKARTEIISFEPEELFGTKLRALLQRNKNRDLFDLNEGLSQLELDSDRLIGCFNHYLALEEKPISRANAEERMLRKLNQSLIEDIAPLLPTGVSYSETDALAAFGKVWGKLIVRIPGDPWKSSQVVIDALRKDQIPTLLKEVY